MDPSHATIVDESTIVPYLLLRKHGSTEPDLPLTLLRIAPSRESSETQLMLTILTAIAVVIGIAGTLLPFVPGIGLVWAAAVWSDQARPRYRAFLSANLMVLYLRTSFGSAHALGLPFLLAPHTLFAFHYGRQRAGAEPKVPFLTAVPTQMSGRVSGGSAREATPRYGHHVRRGTRQGPALGYRPVCLIATSDSEWLS